MLNLIKERSEEENSSALGSDINFDEEEDEADDREEEQSYQDVFNNHFSGGNYKVCEQFVELYGHISAKFDGAMELFVDEVDPEYEVWERKIELTNSTI